MAGQHYYRQVPEASVLASTRTVAQQALIEASWYWEIEAKPGLWWIAQTTKPDPEVVKVHPVPITGFCKTGRRDDGLWDWDIFIVGNQNRREVAITVAHEVAHIYCIEVGFGSMVTRTRQATDEQEKSAHEAFAERFADRFVRTYFENLYQNHQETR